MVRRHENNNRATRRAYKLKLEFLLPVPTLLLLRGKKTGVIGGLSPLRARLFISYVLVISTCNQIF